MGRKMVTVVEKCQAKLTKNKSIIFPRSCNEQKRNELRLKKLKISITVWNIDKFKSVINNSRIFIDYIPT